VNERDSEKQGKETGKHDSIYERKWMKVWKCEHRARPASRFPRKQSGFNSQLVKQQTPGVGAGVKKKNNGAPEGSKKNSKSHVRSNASSFGF